MKIKIHFFLLSLIMPFFLMAQDYQPILTEGSFWDTGNYDHNMAPCVPTPSTRYVLDGAIVINNQTYRQLKVHYINGIEDGPCLVGPFSVEQDFTIDDVYLREDVNERKVYIWSNRISGTYQEYTLYDFSLDVGETIVNPYTDGNSSNVTIIDIQIDNEGRKVFNTSSEYSYTESIGGISGVTAFITPQFEFHPELLCYGNIETNQSNCARFLALDDFILSKINIYPNPVEDILTIASEIPLKISVFSILGKEIRSYDDVTEIDLSNLNQGLYFLKTSSIDGKLQKTFKIEKK